MSGLATMPSTPPPNLPRGGQGEVGRVGADGGRQAGQSHGPGTVGGVRQGPAGSWRCNPGTWPLSQTEWRWNRIPSPTTPGLSERSGGLPEGFATDSRRLFTRRPWTSLPSARPVFWLVVAPSWREEVVFRVLCVCVVSYPRSRCPCQPHKYELIYQVETN